MTQRAPLPDVIITGRLIAVMRQLELPHVKKVAPLLARQGLEPSRSHSMGMTP